MAETDRFAQRSLRAGFYLQSFPDMTLVDTEISLKYWGEEIGKDANVPTIISVYDDIKLMRTDFERGQINFIVASPWVMTQKFKRDTLADGFKTSRADVSLDHLLLLTRRNEGLNDLKSLVGKKLGFVDNDKIFEVYLDVLFLKHMSKRYQQVFKKNERYKKSGKLILSLFFKSVDAIVVFKTFYDVATELNPQIKEQTQVLDSLSGIPWGSGYFYKNVDPAFRELVIRTVVDIQNSARGKQLLQLFLADKIERSSLSDLTATDVLNAEYEQLLRKHQ